MQEVQAAPGLKHLTKVKYEDCCVPEKKHLKPCIGSSMNNPCQTVRSADVRSFAFLLLFANQALGSSPWGPRHPAPAYRSFLHTCVDTPLWHIREFVDVVTHGCSTASLITRAPWR